MTKPISHTLLGLVLLCLGLSAAQAAQSVFTDLGGQPARVADYTGHGQWTVVMIWASDCSVCRHEAPELEAFNRRHQQGVARVVGLSVDGRSGIDDARNFVRDGGLTFPTLVGSAEDVAALFYDETGNNLIGTPAFLIYNPEGQLRSYETGRINMLALERLVQPDTALSVARGQ